MFFKSPVKIVTKVLPSSDPRFPVTHRQELIAGFDQSKLAAAHILLIGAGGIGGEVGEGLCRKGVGRLSLFDHDLVESSNLNRQHFFERDIYQNKATSLARNLAPHCHAGTTLEGNPVSFEDGLALETNMAADVVVCGVDNNAARVAASDHYRNLGVPVIFIAVDFLAECGHVFVQESRPTTACFLCAFPSSLVPKKAPCFVPSSKDILKVTAGFGLYAIDSLLMDRKRNWNFRRIHLAGFAPEVIETITQNPNCPRCGKKAQQGSSNVITY